MSAAWSRARSSPAAPRTRRTRPSSSAAATWPQGEAVLGGRAGKILRQVSRLGHVRLQRLEHHGRRRGRVAGARPLARGQARRGARRHRARRPARRGAAGARGREVAITGRKLDVVQAACDAINRASASRCGAIEAPKPPPSAAPPSRARTSCSPPAPPASRCSKQTQWQASPTLELVADANASPPAGIEGVGAGRSRQRRATARSCSARWASAPQTGAAPRLHRRLFEQNDLRARCRGDLCHRQDDGGLHPHRLITRSHRPSRNSWTIWRAAIPPGRRQRRGHHGRHGRGARLHGVQRHHRQEGLRRPSSPRCGPCCTSPRELRRG